MIPLKADGTMDVKFIEKLPIEDFQELLDEMNREQVDYLFADAKPSGEPIQPLKVDYSNEDLEDWGFGFDADKVLARLRKKHLRN